MDEMPLMLEAYAPSEVRDLIDHVGAWPWAPAIQGLLCEQFLSGIPWDEFVQYLSQDDIQRLAAIALGS
jgi:hypothetical protein